jgi:hypothetical protein
LTENGRKRVSKAQAVSGIGDLRQNIKKGKGEDITEREKT